MRKATVTRLPVAYIMLTAAATVLFVLAITFIGKHDSPRLAAALDWISVEGDTLTVTVDESVYRDYFASLEQYMDSPDVGSREVRSVEIRIFSWGELEGGYSGCRLLAPSSDRFVVSGAPARTDALWVAFFDIATLKEVVLEQHRDLGVDDYPLAHEPPALTFRTPGGVLIRLTEYPTTYDDDHPYITAHFYTGATAPDGTPIVATVHAPDRDTAIDFIDSLRFPDGSNIPATTKVPGE